MIKYPNADKDHPLFGSQVLLSQPSHKTNGFIREDKSTWIDLALNFIRKLLGKWGYLYFV